LPKQNTIWIDSYNADLEINAESAIKFIQSGYDFEKMVSIDLMAKRSQLEIDETEFIEQGLDDEAFKIITYSLIRAKNACIYITDEEYNKIDKSNVVEYWQAFKIAPRLLIDLYRAGRDVTRFTNTMIRAHENQVKLCFSIVDLYSLTDDDFETLVSNLIKVQKFKVSIDQEDLIRQNISGNDINRLVQALIKCKTKGIPMNFSELLQYHVQTGGDVLGFANALIYSDNRSLGFTKEDLYEVSVRGFDVADYVAAIDMAQKNPELDINTSAVKDQFKATGKVCDVIKALQKAKAMGLDLSFALACQIQKNGENISDAIDWATKPQIVEVSPCLSIVAKNGVKITPKVNITVSGKLPLYYSGYGLDVLFQRINEAISEQIEHCETHDIVLKSLPSISNKVLENIREGQAAEDSAMDNLNQYCAYNLHLVNIYDLEIGDNVKNMLDLQNAKNESQIHKIRAISDRAKAEVDLRKAMVEQYREGKIPNFNELHKDNIMNSTSQAGTMYHVDEQEKEKELLEQRLRDKGV